MKQKEYNLHLTCPGYVPSRIRTPHTCEDWFCLDHETHQLPWFPTLTNSAKYQTEKS